MPLEIRMQSVDFIEIWNWRGRPACTLVHISQGNSIHGFGNFIDFCVFGNIAFGTRLEHFKDPVCIKKHRKGNN